jgi:TonB family protein
MKTRFFFIMLLASATSTPAFAQTEVKPGSGQKCQTVERKPVTPTRPEDSGKAAARDSMLADLNVILAGRNVGNGYVVLHVDETRGQRKFETIDLRLERELATSLTARIADFANRFGESVVIGLPIKDRSTAPDSVTEPYEECPPAVRNQAVVTRLLLEKRREMQMSVTRSPDQLLETQLWIFVTERGKSIATIVRRSSGERGYDRAVRDAALRMEFHPALLNGEPRAVWVDIPVRMQVGSR